MNVRAQTSAGGQRRRELSKTARSYRPPALSVNTHRQLFPGRRDRSLPHPPAGNPERLSADGAALGLLVLLLQRRGLPAIVRRHGWGLVERWLRQLVDARLTGGIAR
jgi:hypothetical protein